MGANFKNYLRGKKARLEGIQFEELLHREALRENILVVRMPLGCKRIGKNKLIQIKTPFDFVLVHNGQSVFIDCKSFDSDRITHSQLTTHQVIALTRIEEKGCTAGYAIWLRKASCVAFVKASKLADLQPNESIKAEDMTLLGTIENFGLGRLFTIGLEK